MPTFTQELRRSSTRYGVVEQVGDLYPELRYARALKKSLFYKLAPFTEPVEGVKLDFEGFFSALAR
jgi:hypothetical protein